MSRRSAAPAGRRCCAPPTTGRGRCPERHALRRLIRTASLLLALVAAGGTAAAGALPAQEPMAATRADDLRPRLLALDGRGLVLTPQALYRFQPENEAWTTAAEAEGLPAPPLAGLSLAADDLWIFGQGASVSAAKLDDWQPYAPGEGYPGRRIYAIEADEDYAYAGTDAGVGRFDRFVLEWEPLPVETQRPFGPVRDVAVGETRVWFALDYGVAEYRKQTESVRVDSLLGGLAAPRVLALRLTSQYLWAVTPQGLARYDIELETWTSFTAGVDLPDTRVHQATLVGEDLWLGTDAGLWRYQADSGIWRRDETQAEMPGQRVRAFSRQNGLWVITERACAYYDESAARWIDFTPNAPLAPSAVREIGWVEDALLLLGRERIAYALRRQERNPQLFVFYEQAVRSSGPETHRTGGRFALDQDGFGWRRSPETHLLLKGGATVYIEDDDASKAPGESDFENLIHETRYDLILNGQLGAGRSLSGLYDTTDPDDETYLLSYRGRRDDRLRGASAGEIDPEYFNSHLLAASGIRGGWARLETGARAATTRRRRVTSEVWAGERRTYPGRQVFYGEQEVYRLEHGNLVRASEEIRLDRELLRAAADYTIDWEHGSFTLAEHVLVADDTAIEVRYRYELDAGDDPADASGELSRDQTIVAGQLGIAPSAPLYIGAAYSDWSPRADERAQAVDLNARYEQRGADSYLRLTPEAAFSSGGTADRALGIGLRARYRGLEVSGRHRDLAAGFETLEDRRTLLGRLRRDTELSARWSLSEHLVTTLEWDETRSDRVPVSDSAAAARTPAAARETADRFGRGSESRLVGGVRLLANGFPNIGLSHGRVAIDSLGEVREKRISRAELELTPPRAWLASAGIQRLWLRAYFQRDDLESARAIDALGNTRRRTDHTFVRLNGSAGDPLAWNLDWDERWTYRPEARWVSALERTQEMDLAFQSRPHPALDAYVRWEAERDLRWEPTGGPGGFDVQRQLTMSHQLYPGYLLRPLQPLSLRLDASRTEIETGEAGDPLPSGAALWRAADEARGRTEIDYNELEARLQLLSWLRLVDRLRRERTDASAPASDASNRYRLFENRFELRPRGGLIILRTVFERREAQAVASDSLTLDQLTRARRFASEWNQTWGGGLLTFLAFELERTTGSAPEPLWSWSPQARVTVHRDRGRFAASLGTTYRYRELYAQSAADPLARPTDRRTLNLSTSLSVRMLRLVTLKLLHQATLEAGEATDHAVDLRLQIRA